MNSETDPASKPLVSAKDLRVEFPVPGGTVRALDDVSISVYPGETLGVVGESGCGKTTLARALLGLQPVTGGVAEVVGEKVSGVSRGQASRVGMVWQDPYASLDPRWTVKRSALEPSRLAGKAVDAQKLFTDVGLDPAFLDRYPHQLSGGQRQRVAIARALSLRPPVVICDEPTAALDLSVRAQILNLLNDIQKDLGCALLYISHDLTTVRFLADRIAVMYLGRIVEEGPAEEVFTRPRHPYTKALVDSAPTLEKIGLLPEPVKGEIPDPRTRFPGCRYAGRCPRATDICLTNDPAPRQVGGSIAFCHHPHQDSEDTDVRTD